MKHVPEQKACSDAYAHGGNWVMTNQFRYFFTQLTDLVHRRGSHLLGRVLGAYGSVPDVMRPLLDLVRRRAD